MPQKLCSTYERLALPWQSNEKVSQTPAQKWGADRRRTEQNILKEAPEHRLSGSMGVKSVQSITSAQLIELSSTHTHTHIQEKTSHSPRCLALHSGAETRRLIETEVSFRGEVLRVLRDYSQLFPHYQSS